MSNKGVFIGTYIDSALKDLLRARATRANRTLSQELQRIVSVVVSDNLLTGEDSDHSLKCQRCEYIWQPRKAGTPRRCPRCKSPYWNRARVRNIKRDAA